MWISEMGFLWNHKEDKHVLTYCIQSNYCTYPYERIVKQFPSLQINPLKTEETVPHYILEESNFNFRYAQVSLAAGAKVTEKLT